MPIKAHRLEELELLLTLLSLLLAFLQPRLSQPFFRGLLTRLRRLARRPWTSMLFVAALPVLLRFALLPWIAIPQPQIQEEFSNLMAADTFAHGRLANPPHPMGIFFDNPEEIQTPHYASARPPGDAFFLSLGEIFFHVPWLGVCLSVSLMCAAFYWMLRAWTRPQWALLTAILFALRFGVFTYWMNSYWGGSVSALGGALVLGAFPRLTRGSHSIAMLDRRQARDAALFALGCCLLASTRPYEGLACTLPPAILLIVWWMRAPGKAAMLHRFTGTLLPIATVLALYFAWLGYYDSALTGAPLRTAYQLWRQQQGVVPIFWWQSLRNATPLYYSRQMEQFHAIWEVAIYRSFHRSFFAAVLAVATRPVVFLHLYLRPLLLLPFVAGTAGLRDLRSNTAAPAHRGSAGVAEWLWLASLPFFLYFGLAPAVAPLFLVWIAIWIFFRGSRQNASRRKFAIVIAILATGVVFSSLTNFSMPTYYAPFTGAAFVLVAVGMRRFAAWGRPRRIGSAIVANLSLSCCLMWVACANLAIFHMHVLHESPFNWSSYENRLPAREKTEMFLRQQPGSQLAIVRYGETHDVLLEWVWNGAEVDRQKIVWARELKPEWTAQLVHYYAGRTVWLIEPDTGTVRPYPVGELPAQGSALLPLTYRQRCF